MRHGSTDLIPKKFSVPSHPVNRPDEKRSREEVMLDKKLSDRVMMDDDVFERHHGHEKGADTRLRPYTG